VTISHDRKGVIDALRGYFIIWIGFYNTFAVFNAIQPNLVLSSILLFINDKGWFCLSAIFGYGFGVLIKKSNGSGFVFQKRMLLLFGIGIFNNLFFYGDILKEYAIIGLIIFYTKSISTKFPISYLLSIFIITLLALYIVPFDMQRAGDLKSYFADNNPFFANLKYCYRLNTQSLYFGICYHLEMLLLASIGYFMAFYQLESVIVLHRRKLFYGAFFSMSLCLLLIFFKIQKDDPLIKITFFSYILSLSVWFVLGFYGFTKKYQSFSSLLANFGRRSLTIYLLQNFLICTIWLWSETPDFRIYCLGQLLILFLSQWFTKNGIGIVECYWRRWSQTTHEIGIR
jgi:uncharacterized protein